MPKKQEVSTQWAYCVSFSLPLKLLQWSRQSLKYRQESSITACLLVQIEKLVGWFVWYDLPSFCQLETFFPPCLGWKRRQKQRYKPTNTKKSFLTLLLKWGLDSCSHILRGFRVWETGSLFFCSEWLVRVLCLTTEKNCFPALGVCITAASHYSSMIWGKRWSLSLQTPPFCNYHHIGLFC